MLFWVSYMHVFCIFVFALVQRKLSMFHVERHSRDTLIIIINIITIIGGYFLVTSHATTLCSVWLTFTILLGLFVCWLVA